MTADLVQFLRARLDEIDGACRAARKDGGGAWNLLAFDRGDGAIYDDMGNPVLTYDTDPETGVPTDPMGSPLGARQAAHIVRHDPDRVLAEVEAKRQIVAPYAAALEDRQSIRARMREVIYKEPDEFGRLLKQENALIDKAEALDPVVRALALPHADHPDYRPEWRLSNS